MPRPPNPPPPPPPRRPPAAPPARADDLVALHAVAVDREGVGPLLVEERVEVDRDVVVAERLIAIDPVRPHDARIRVVGVEREVEVLAVVADPGLGVLGGGRPVERLLLDEIGHAHRAPPDQVVEAAVDVGPDVRARRAQRGASGQDAGGGEPRGRRLSAARFRRRPDLQAAGHRGHGRRRRAPAGRREAAAGRSGGLAAGPTPPGVGRDARDTGGSTTTPEAPDGLRRSPLGRRGAAERAASLAGAAAAPDPVSETARRPPAAGARPRGRDGRPEPVRHPILKREEIADRTVDLDPGRDGAGRGVDHARGDAHPIAQPLVAAGDEPRRAPPAARGARRPLRIVVARVEGGPRHLAAQRFARDDPHPVEPLEVGRHRLRDARAHPVVGGLGRDVEEGSDRDSPGRRASIRSRSGGGLRARDTGRSDQEPPDQDDQHPRRGATDDNPDEARLQGVPPGLHPVRRPIPGARLRGRVTSIPATRRRRDSMAEARGGLGQPANRRVRLRLAPSQPCRSLHRSTAQTPGSRTDGPGTRPPAPSRRRSGALPP